MLNKKSRSIIASVITLLSLLSVIYTSCTKVGDRSPYSCTGVFCQNTGFCDSGRCVCPRGYEGPNCATASVTKYIATWNIDAKIVGSDSVNVIGKDSSYTVYLVKSGTPTTFFINNFSGDANYNDVVCVIDSANTHHFVFDTLSTFHMLYDNYHMLYGYGSISDDNNTITANVAIRHRNKTVNWQNDTMSLTLTRR